MAAKWSMESAAWRSGAESGGMCSGDDFTPVEPKCGGGRSITVPNPNSSRLIERPPAHLCSIAVGQVAYMAIIAGGYHGCQVVDGVGCVAVGRRVRRDVLWKRFRTG